MGTACIKKEKGHKEAPMYSNSKLTMVSQDPMLNTRFSRLNCPIENLKIIDKRKEI